MHTMVLENTTTQHSFLTLAFGVNDDPKLSSHDLNMISLSGIPLGKILPYLGLSQSDIWGEDETSHSLWNAKLYPIGNTPEESAGMTCQLLDVILKLLRGERAQKRDWRNVTRSSVSKAIGTKDMHGQVCFFSLI